MKASSKVSDVPRGPWSDAWLASLLAALAVFAVGGVAPRIATLPTPAWQVALHLGEIAGVVAFTAGVRLHQPARRSIWMLLGFSLAAVALSGLLVSLAVVKPGSPVAVGLFHAAAISALVFVVALALARRHRRAEATQWEALADAFAIGAAVAIVLSQTVLGGRMVGGGEQLLPGALAVGVVLILSTLVALTAQAVFTRQDGLPAALLLTAGAVLAAVSAAAAAWVSRRGQYVLGSEVAAIVHGTWAAGSLCCAAAALHPRMAALTAPAEPSARHRTGPVRVALLVAALLTPAAVGVWSTALQVFRGTATLSVIDIISGILPAAAGLLLGVTIAVRLWRLVVSREAARQGLAIRLAQQAGLAELARRGLEEPELDSFSHRAAGVIIDILHADRCMIDTMGVSVALGAGRATTPSATPAARLSATIQEGHLDQPSATADAGATVTVERHEGPPFDDDDLHVLEAVAAVVSAAVQRHAAESEAAYRAYHDALTGLPNRASLQDHLDELIVSAGGALPHDLGLLFIDLDGFKTVNDTLGHTAGDELLTEVAQRLRLAVRDHDFVARLAGDEFVVVCGRLVEPSEITAVADRVHDALRAQFELSDGRAEISASIGAATGALLSTEDAPGARDSGGVTALRQLIINAADEGMYEAKQRPHTATAMKGGKRPTHRIPESVR